MKKRASVTGRGTQCYAVGKVMKKQFGLISFFFFFSQGNFSLKVSRSLSQPSLNLLPWFPQVVADSSRWKGDI